MFGNIKKIHSNDFIGIDFGTHAIKALAISRGKGVFQIDAVAEVPIAKGLIVDNHFEDITKLTQVIRLLRKNFPPSYKNAAIAVTGADVITKVIPMNAGLSDLELEAQVELEVENSIPFPIDEIFLDFEVISPNANSTGINDVLVSAARKETVLSRVGCVEAAGLTTKVVDVANHALARACEFSFVRDDYDKGIAFVDIGASHMMLNILHQGQVIFSRSKNHGGAVCTQMLADHSGLKFEEAEKIKIEHNWPVDCNDEVITPFINQTVNYLRFDLRMFTNAPHNIQVEKLLLTGGGALMKELVDQLSHELDLKVEVDNPFASFEFKNESDKISLCDIGPKYMTALGLALRGVL